METEGLIEGEEQARGERGTRRVYHVTDAGDRAFIEWMRSPLDYQRVRDPAHLRAAYLENTSPDAARAFFRGHIARVGVASSSSGSGSCAASTPATTRCSSGASRSRPSDEHERTVAYKRLAYEGLVERATARSPGRAAASSWSTGSRPRLDSRRQARRQNTYSIRSMPSVRNASCARMPVHDRQVVEAHDERVRHARARARPELPLRRGCRHPAPSC